MSTVGNWRGPNIVKDGLVLYLDAGSPNSFSQVNPSTSWNDISGNGYNGTLTNGPTFNSADGGSIVFDGVNDRVNLTSSPNLTNNFSISIWTRITTSTPGHMFGFYVSSSPFNGWALACSFNPVNSGTLNFWDGTAWRNSGINISDSLLRYITVTINNTNLISFYINGVFNISVQGSNIPLYVGNKTIGSRSDGLTPLKGNIYNTQLYNRVLSATEILQNFNTTKGRFGL
jgi:hypothetical protein